MTKLKEERISEQDLAQLIEYYNNMETAKTYAALRELKSLRHPWVSVKDALPSKGVTVLGCDDAGKVRAATWSGLYWMWQPGSYNANVTYWSPLPPAPEGE